MNGNLVRAALDQSREPSPDIRMFNLQKGSFNQSKAAMLTDTPRRFAHVIVCFLAPAAVTHDQHAAIYFSHPAAPASENFSCAQ